MSNIIDVTGVIKNGMWCFDDLYPKLNIVQRTGTAQGFGEYHYTEIEGMHTQVGTYIETPAHFYGHDKSFLINDIPLENLVNVGCVVLKVPKDVSDTNKKIAVTKDDLLTCPNIGEIRPGDCIAVYCGWEKHWMNSEVFFSRSPYFTMDAMQFLISKKPSIMASDTVAWDNFSDPAGFFPDFYAANILMLTPLVNLSEVTKPRVKITALPLRFDDSSSAPCRAIIIED